MVESLTKHPRTGCPDLDPDWPGVTGFPRGPRLCALYPNCKCGKEDRMSKQTHQSTSPAPLCSHCCTVTVNGRCPDPNCNKHWASDEKALTSNLKTYWFGLHNAEEGPVTPGDPHYGYEARDEFITIRDYERLRAALVIAQRYLHEREFPIDHPVRSAVDNALSGDLSAPETTAPHRDTERLKWLANTVLCCDYGDNSHPSKLIGWRVVEFVAPVIYGKTLEEAIDAGMDDEFHRRRQRSVKPTIADLEKILQSEDTTPVTILPDGTIATAPSAEETTETFRQGIDRVRRELHEHSTKGLASAGSSAAVNPRDTVGGSAEPSGRPADQKCINGCGRPRQSGSQHCDECDPNSDQ